MSDPKKMDEFGSSSRGCSPADVNANADAGALNTPDGPARGVGSSFTSIVRNLKRERQALKREVADLSREVGEFLQSRAHWRARARLAEAELSPALASLDEERRDSKVREAQLEELRAALDLAKVREGVDDTAISTLERELNATRKHCDEHAEAEEKLAAKVVELSAAPAPMGENGARFELHRILLTAKGKSPKWVLDEVKRIRDLLGGAP